MIYIYMMPRFRITRAPQPVSSRHLSGFYPRAIVLFASSPCASALLTWLALELQLRLCTVLCREQGVLCITIASAEVPASYKNPGWFPELCA